MPVADFKVVSASSKQHLIRQQYVFYAGRDWCSADAGIETRHLKLGVDTVLHMFNKMAALNKPGQGYLCAGVVVRDS